MVDAVLIGQSEISRVRQVGDKALSIMFSSEDIC